MEVTDGVYGDDTVTAVVRWQQQHGVTPTSGFFGGKSRAALNISAPAAANMNSYTVAVVLPSAPAPMPAPAAVSGLIPGAVLIAGSVAFAAYTIQGTPGGITGVAHR